MTITREINNLDLMGRNSGLSFVPKKDRGIVTMPRSSLEIGRRGTMPRIMLLQLSLKHLKIPHLILILDILKFFLIIFVTIYKNL